MVLQADCVSTTGSMFESCTALDRLGGRADGGIRASGSLDPTASTGDGRQTTDDSATVHDNM
jgi:hypothetical protein